MKIDKLFLDEAMKMLRERGGTVGSATYPNCSFYLKEDLGIMWIGDERPRQILFSDFYVLASREWIWESDDNKEFLINSDELTAMVDNLVSDLKPNEKLAVAGKLDKLKAKLKVKEKGKL